MSTPIASSQAALVRELTGRRLSRFRSGDLLVLIAFPVLTSDVLSRFLERSKTEPQRTVLKAFREWLRTQK